MTNTHNSKTWTGWPVQPVELGTKPLIRLEAEIQKLKNWSTTEQIDQKSMNCLNRYRFKQ